MVQVNNKVYAKNDGTGNIDNTCMTHASEIIHLI